MRVLADGLDTVRPSFTAEPPAHPAPPQPAPHPANQKAAATRPYAVPLTSARGPRR
jgi:hypothetical protein